MKDKVLSGEEGESVNLPGLVIAGKVTADDTNRAYSIVELVIAPRFIAAPPHVHRREDETSYLLEGDLTSLVGERIVDVSVGSFVFMPKGIPHTFWNPGNESARLLLIISPAGLEKYFTELSRLFGNGGLAISGIMALAAKYGLEFYR